MANTNSRRYPKGLREIRYPSDDIIQRFTSKDYTGYISLNNTTGEFEFNPPLTTDSSSGTSFTTTQTAHGFSSLQPLYHNGSEFALANASDDSTLGMWIVTSVTGEDAFTASQSGRFEIEDHGLTVGQYYFVSETDGGLTPTEPDSYSNPLIYVESDTAIHVLPFRPASTSATSGGGSGDVTSVFGRTGAVIAVTGDYTAEQVGLGNVLNQEQALASDLGVADGIATLGSDGKVPDDQLPASVVGGIDIIGFWDADTNSPDLSALTLSQGEAYQVSVAGTTELNSISSWALYDLAIWDDSVTGNWFKLTSSNLVSSVNDMTGAVVLDTDDIDEGSTNEYYTEDRVSANTDVVANTAKVSADGSVSTHSDVDTETVEPTSGQALIWDGSNWAPGSSTGLIDSVNTQTGVVVLDADDISDSSTTNKFTTADEITKLSGIEELAEVNNISDTDAEDLTDGLESTLHYHASDRARSTHTGTQSASTISDFDDTVSANDDVAANTDKVSADASINTHSDVDTNTDTPVLGQSLCWDGTNWIPCYVDDTLPAGIEGDIVYNDGSDWVTLPIGDAEQVITSDGTTISWAEGSTMEHADSDNFGYVSRNGAWYNPSQLVETTVTSSTTQLAIDMRNMLDYVITLDSTVTDTPSISITSSDGYAQYKEVLFINNSGVELETDFSATTYENGLSAAYSLPTGNTRIYYKKVDDTLYAGLIEVAFSISGTAGSILKINAEGTDVEEAGYTYDQVLQTDSIDISDDTWVDQEERLLLVKKNIDSETSEETATLEGAATLIDIFAPSTIDDDLEDQDDWSSESKTLTGENYSGELGKTGQIRLLDDGTICRCTSYSTGTDGGADGSATYKRNRAYDTLDPDNVTQDSDVADLLDPSRTSGDIDDDWDLTTNIKVISTVPCKLGTWWNVAGSYSYFCYAVSGTSYYWFRQGTPSAIYRTLTTTSYPIVTANLEAHDFTSGNYSDDSGDEDTYQDQIYYSSTSGALYWKVAADSWAKFYASSVDSNLRASVELTNAEIKALLATPITLVDAQGTDTIIIVDNVTTILYAGTEVLSEAGDNLALRYDSSTTDLVEIETTGFIDQLVNSVSYNKVNDISIPTSEGSNIALEIYNNGAAEIAGNATADATMKIIVNYKIISL